MKKGLSIILLLLLLYNLVGYHAAFKVMRKQISKEVKRAIKKSMPEEDLVPIQVSTDDNNSLFWTKKDKEFRYKEEMYDVVRKEIISNTITYFCIHDFKESKLFDNFDLFLSEYMDKNPQKYNCINLIKRLIQSVYYHEIRQIIIFRKLSNSVDFYLNSYYNSIAIDKLTPPPKSHCHIPA